MDKLDHDKISKALGSNTESEEATSNDKEILQASVTLAAMCVDFRMGRLNQDTFVSNLKFFSNKINELHNKDKFGTPSCGD